MKKLYTILFAIVTFSIGYSQSADDFIMTYEVDNSTGLYVQYPFYGNNFTIDLGDGNTLTNEDVSSTGIHHIYSEPGTYTIIVSGDINRVIFDGGAGYYMYQKVKTIEQWGTAQWISMEDAFSGLQELTVNATDIPDLSLVTSMRDMFNGCHSFNSPINDWDVSNVTNMYKLFYEAFAFNQPLDNWDVSNVTNMLGMFGRATSFNQNINSWDVSNVTDMVDMFGFFPEDNCSFNQPLNNWNVSNVTNMYWMFRNNISFNQPLNNWDVSNVTDFGYMFYNASSFNQNINSWNTVSATSMSGMFQGASSFNQPLNNWDLSNNIRIKMMFKDATSFDQPLDNWNTSNVIYMKGVFHNASLFNQDISGWNFENVIDFTNGSTQETFIGHTSMNTDNYDALLLALVQSGLQNKVLQVNEIEYCDTEVRSYLENQADWWIIGDQLSNECIDYTISGSVLLDTNNNGCDVNDTSINDFFVKATGNGFEYGSFILDGNYSIEANQGSFNLNIINLPNYLTSNPITENSTLTNNNQTDTKDFCLIPNQSVEDLNLTILPINSARPGFESNYILKIKNIGTEIMEDASASFTFDDAKQSFISAIPSETNTTSNSINFSLGALHPFESAEIEITMQNFIPPILNADDVLTLTGITLPNSNDYTPNDNSYELEQTVVNAFDPNDKRVLQGETITIDESGEYLDYIIRFQNTGSANATFVRIEDELDEELDWNTLRMISSSHEYKAKISDGNQVEFIFENINLPFASEDEIGSQGYIAYKIKPKSTIQVGDVMSGNASIYFDYNQPIETNIVSTEVIDDLDTDKSSYTNSLTIYPNPVNDYFNIRKSNGVSIESLKLYNLSGKLLKEYTEAENYFTNDLKSGLYILKIKTIKTEATLKLIKI